MKMDSIEQQNMLILATTTKLSLFSENWDLL